MPSRFPVEVSVEEVVLTLVSGRVRRLRSIMCNGPPGRVEGSGRHAAVILFLIRDQSQRLKERQIATAEYHCISVVGGVVGPVNKSVYYRRQTRQPGQSARTVGHLYYNNTIIYLNCISGS